MKISICLGYWGRNLKGFYGIPKLLNGDTRKKNDPKIYRRGWWHVLVGENR